MRKEEKEKLWIKIIHLCVQTFCLALNIGTLIVTPKISMINVLCTTGIACLFCYAVHCLTTYIDELEQKHNWW